MSGRGLPGAAGMVCFGVLALASCASNVSTATGGAGTGGAGTGGTVTTSTVTTSDGGGDAGYLACMDGSGQLYGSLKTCQTDSGCVVAQEQTDCCGTILYVGVDTASAQAFAACEADWVAHFPACGCASNQTRTEDGKTSTFGSDAGAPMVHCIDFTMNGGVCMTYTP